MSSQSSPHGYSSGGRRNYGKELKTSVAQNECFKCGRPGHWAKDCPSAGDQDKYGRKMGRAPLGWCNYGGGHSSSVGRNECFKCGRPGHWARDCPSATDQEMHGSGQAGGDDSNNDYIVYSYGGRRSTHWEDDCFKCGRSGHWQRECPSSNGGGGNDIGTDGKRREIERGGHPQDFTSHLLAALDREQIKTYIDDELKIGEEIEPALLKAIEESKLSVVILSQNYASSTWCLDELAHIMECKERNKQLVIPIFYEVDPSHVRHQRESYAAAFVRHEEHFKDKPDKVLKWRDALTKSSKLAGLDSRSFRQESELVEGVVEVVKDDVMKLNRECSSDLKGLVGIESHIKLCIAPQDSSPPGYSSVGRRNYGKELKTSVAQNECFKCGRPGHWAKACPSAGDQDMYVRKMGRASSGWSNYGGGDSSCAGRNECFKCGRPGHWARDCPSATDQEMHGSGQAGGDDSNNDYIVYSYGGRRSPYWENVCFKCGWPGHWQHECPSANGGGGNDDDSD